MAAGECPAAQLAPGHQIVLGHRLDHGAGLLVLELPDVPLVSPRAHGEPQEDVAGGLQSTLAGNDPGAVARLAAWPEESLIDGSLGLLGLQEERIVA